MNLFNECFDALVAIFDAMYVIVGGQVAVVRVGVIQELNVDGIIIAVMDLTVVDVLDL
jgi:hypothetical protein